MSQLTSAFWFGIISACSLPLGAITARFYRPGDRTIAFLMSFGGGALLAALTIDLAGPALEKGHFYPLASGCVFGGILFVTLNQIVNRHGGFLRKASTTIFYLRGQRRRRHKRFIERMQRLDVLRCLSARDLQDLADASTSQPFEAGTTIFRRLDPARYLYVVEEGIVELVGADNVSQQLKRNDAFGHMALLSGSPHATSAIASEDSTVLMVPREALARAVRTNVDLRGALADFLESEKVARYLCDVQKIPLEAAAEFVRHAAAAVQRDAKIPPKAEFRGGERFSDIVNGIRRVSFFSDLPDHEVEEIAAHVYLKRHEQGHTFFYRGEKSDRMYIVESGQIALLDAADAQRSTTAVGQREAFGAMSFITGTRHAATAVASSETSVWVLLRVDFDQLLNHCPALARSIQEFLQQKEVETYLESKHHFDPDMVAAWVHRAVKSAEHGRLIPHAGEDRGTIGPQHGAPLAIWLGILLDGIPESLVIGSSMLHDGVSLSLIAALFLANYPEALSSSVGMRQQGIAFPRVLLMWTSLMLITGIGAALGNLFFREAPTVVFSSVEGIAVGAMLTMIAETMLPEAYFKGGSVVGFSTLLGFLAAIFFKTIG